ncbi:MAG: secG [Gemmatimonadetes bacterium]|nr:secG [Gemmatimonadota bacterium]
MYAFLLVLLILDALLLSTVVLLQAGQGGGLAALGGAGTESVLGGRQAVTILTKLSWWCGGIFLGLSLLLSVMHRSAGASDLQQQLRQAAPPTSQAPSGPSPLQGLTPAPGAATPGAAAPAATAPAPATTVPATPAPSSK